jgi:transcriptional regulator with XRE-family HTH domain
MMASFGRRIRELRTALHLTQWDVAHQTGVSNTYISALESGRKPAPPHAVVFALAACLQTDPEDLWLLARKEREERLLDRIQGIPTSMRRRTTPTTGDTGDGTSEAGDELSEVLQSLTDAAQTPAQRRALAGALKTLARRLDA